MTSWISRLRLSKPAPIEPANPGAHPRSQFHALSGVQMRLIGWAIALAAAGLTPAAAQTSASAPAQNLSAPSAPAKPPAGAAQNSAKPDAAQPASVVPGTVGHAIPTPHLGQPAG